MKHYTFLIEYAELHCNDYRKTGKKIFNKNLLFEYYYRNLCIQYIQDELSTSLDSQKVKFCDEICNAYSTIPIDGPALQYLYLDMDDLTIILKCLKTNKVFVKAFVLANKDPTIVRDAKKKALELVNAYFKELKKYE